ncbi:MAG: hypothetical protein GX200_04315 [Firmicutes bacterium]|nr:hypothetical protein [Bacillota bacterium]
MSTALSKEMAVKRALRIKKLMAFAYRYGLFGQKRAKVGVEDFIDTRHGKVRVLKYGFAKEEIKPLYIDMHGGGFILMHADADEAMNIQFAQEAGVKKLSPLITPRRLNILFPLP